MTALCHHLDCKYQHYFLNYQIFEHKNINNPNHHTHYPDHNRDGIGLGKQHPGAGAAVAREGGA